MVRNFNNASHQPHALEAGTCTIHSKIFHKKNIRWGAARCRDSSQASPWFAFLGARLKEALEFYQSMHAKCTTIQGVDLTQTPDRAPATASYEIDESVPIVAPTLLPRSYVWMMMPDPQAGAPASLAVHSRLTVERPLIPWEHLLLQGWPVRNSPVDLTKERALQRDLAGNAFSGTTFISFLLTFLFTVPWTPEAKIKSRTKLTGTAAADASDDLDKAMMAVTKRRRR